VARRPRAHRKPAAARLRIRAAGGTRHLASSPVRIWIRADPPRRRARPDSRKPEAVRPAHPLPRPVSPRRDGCLQRLYHGRDPVRL